MGGTAITIIILLFVVLIGVVAYFFRRRPNFKASITGPAGLSAAVEASDKRSAPPTGSTITRSTAAGNVEAIDYTGRRASVSDVESKGSIRTVTGRPSEDPPSKKA